MAIKIVSIPVLQALCLGVCAAFATASSAASDGIAFFSTAGHTYPGTYSTADKLVKVDIDGLAYKGHYTSRAEDTAGAASGIPAGSWGRAFLFASSAKVLQCQLDTGFPKVSGQCLGSDGRKFELNPGDEKLKSSALKSPASK